MESFEFGRTSTNLPLIAYRVGYTGPQILVLGGVHGDEPEGVIAAQGLWGQFQNNFPFKVRLTLVPQFNLDGIMNQNRMNGRGVDLNRNLPTQDWQSGYTNPRYNPGPSPASEPENLALLRYLETFPPKIIYSLHSWNPMINTNGPCQPEADVLAKHTGYIVNNYIGYPTPGSLGTYCGHERDIPTITYEIERGLNHEAILQTHVPALFEAIKISSKRFQ